MTKYSERLNDIAVIQLNTEGFNNLTEKQKQLSYYLAQAGLWGRFISMYQGSEYNIPLINNLIMLYKITEEEKELNKELKDTLFTLFAHNGMYHSMSGERLSLPIKKETLLNYKDKYPEIIDLLYEIIFSEKIQQFRTVQTEGVDVVKSSGGNFYKNLTTQEVQEFRKNNYPKVDNDEVPPFGFNERLIKNENNVIEREIICENGLYGNYVKKINENLRLALEYVENDKQKKSIESLIKFYETGDAFDFDKHCVEWTNDKESNIYYINGLIESYDDPLSVGCGFESIVAFKNPLQTEKVNKIIDNIQWFENELPIKKEYKKDKAVGLSASSVTVISMAGETSPSLPLGINLPNSDWIRAKHGSKSVNLENVASSRSEYEVVLREELYLKKYEEVLKKYNHITNSLHTDLHEIAGHGSGKILEGCSADNIGVYYSTIEEARADLVALYFMSDEKLKEFKIVDEDVNVQEAALAQYVSYITNGAFGQLRRVNLGNDLTQAHFRNRQLIANYVLENGDKDKVCLIKENGKSFIEINDINYVKNLLGDLLYKVQEIKSTGNFEEAKNLVMRYGTKVNIELHKEIIERIEKLDMPKVVGFITPILKENNNTIVIEQSNNFIEQQIDLFEKYNELKQVNKIKLK